MSDLRKLVPNVTEFLSKAAEHYGAMKAQEFAQFRFGELVDRPTGTPIEDLFWIAVVALAEARGLALNDLTGDARGVVVRTQCQIGRYRVDFLLQCIDYGQQVDPETPGVVIELDGHDFHDKDKHQRAYEKRRDRELVKAGHKVLHFTGSEVTADPFRVAHEVLELVGFPRGEYDPANPLEPGW